MSIITDHRPGGGDRAPHQVLLTSGEAAAVLQVVPQTVIRWANDGTLECTRTAGGHRRFREPDVQLGFLWGGLTMGMLLSVPLMLAGLAFMAVAMRREWP